MTASPATPNTEQQVTLTVTISQTNGQSAGFFLTSDLPVGTFKAIQSGTAVSAGGVMHTMPRTGSDGLTTFQAGWSATRPTGVRFTVYALSANGDDTPRGDGGNEASLAMTAGCAGMDYHVDQDGDGYGTSDPAFAVARDCTQPDGYAAVTGDCNDVDPKVHPGAIEACNGKDDNCDGQIDEGLSQQSYCRDYDGDGHGIAAQGQESSCRPMAGYGDCAGDCDDNDPTAYKQVTCGVGWCKRSALGCSTACTPGPPRAESCNAFDDDCDGVADNGTDLQLCGAAGKTCVAGICVAGADGGGAGGQASGSGGSTPSGSGGSGPSGSGGQGASGSGAPSPPAAAGCGITPEQEQQTLSEVALSIVALAVTQLCRRRRDT